MTLGQAQPTNGSLHSGWLNRMLSLQPGEHMTLTEAEVVRRGSTLRSAKITMWQRARAVDRPMWFQRHRRRDGSTAMVVTRPLEGQVRGPQGVVDGVVAHVSRLAPGERAVFEGENASPAGRTRQALADAGVAATVRHRKGTLDVLRWRDEYGGRLSELRAEAGARTHPEAEAALAQLAVGESVDLDYQAQSLGPCVRRIGANIGATFVTETARNEAGTRVLRVTRLAKPRPGSPLRPWLQRFLALGQGESYVTTIAAVVRAGGSYRGLASRLYVLAASKGGRVSVTRGKGNVITVIRR